MLYEVMKHIRDYFPTGEAAEGTLTIKDGKISLPFLKAGQYFLIEGSTFNDGVHNGTKELQDETFTGRVSALRPPSAFLDLVKQIEDFEAKAGQPGPFQSESFGGYSYTRATNASGNIAGWQDVFKTKLNAWRKI